MKTSIRQTCLCLLLASLCLFAPLPSWAEEVQQSSPQPEPTESFERSRSPEREKKGNILNIILDKAPALSTERGTLVIDAFIDDNANGVWEESETDLKGEISCTLDEIDYPVPAFIPGLDYNARYKISCQGNDLYQPTLNQKNVLVARRGQIIKLTIPCRAVTD